MKLILIQSSCEKFVFREYLAQGVVIGGHNLDISTLLFRGAIEVAADAAKAINIRRGIYRSCAICLGLQSMKEKTI